MLKKKLNIYYIFNYLYRNIFNEKKIISSLAKNKIGAPSYHFIDLSKFNQNDDIFYPKIGDVITYEARRFNGSPVGVFSHRIIGGNLASGFIVKGTTIQNFDKTNSYAKRGHLPDVEYILNNPKVPCKKYLSSMNRKPKAPSGRINSNCILLKVY
mgnify:CR=1 FL=1